MQVFFRFGPQGPPPRTLLFGIVRYLFGNYCAILAGGARERFGLRTLPTISFQTGSGPRGRRQFVGPRRRGRSRCATSAFMSEAAPCQW